MKKPTHHPLARFAGLLLLVATVTMNFTGCSRDEDSHRQADTPTDSADTSKPGWFSRLTGFPGKLASTKRELDAARAAAAQAERDAQAMRVLLDSQRDATERVGKSRSFWRVASTVLIALAIVAIFAGAAIGSFARHSHQQQVQRDAHSTTA